MYLFNIVIKFDINKQDIEVDYFMILIKSIPYLLYYQISFQPFFLHGFSLKFITLSILSIFIPYCSLPP